ncbi:MAG: NAD(+)/NADH kinase, partial [Vallitaleaceae bacterium]|nr:NAD(+)/NADH kinase [Vallitaleaceae bacterium]
FFVIPNTGKQESRELTEKIVAWLSKYQYEVFVTEEIGQLYQLEQYARSKEEAYNRADCAIVLGGDGTILSTAREVGLFQCPLLGVNIGNLGFLAEVGAKDILLTLADLVNGKFTIEDRMMLQTKIVENGQTNNIGLALNDIVATRASISRMVGYSVYVNNDLVNHYYADGIIVSTPTGSTAYNLSAGGPILAPSNEMIVITPICPHSLTARSIVISSNDQVKISFEFNRASWDKDLQVTIDGQQVVNINNESEVIIEKSPISTHLIKMGHDDFYSLLRKKLGNS